MEDGRIGDKKLLVAGCDKGVSPPWKTEYPEGCSTAIRRVARKVATVEGRLVGFRGGITAGM